MYELQPRVEFNIVPALRRYKPRKRQHRTDDANSTIIADAMVRNNSAKTFTTNHL